MFRLLAFVMVPFLGCFAAEVEKSSKTEAPGEFPKPADGRPWKHDGSGIQLPQRLTHMTMVGGYRYETPELGVSMNYANPDGRAKADVYVYPCAEPRGSEEEKLKSASGEAGKALGGIKEMEKQGRYTKVEIGEGESWKIPLSSKEKTAFVEVPLSYAILEDAGTGKAPTAVRSRLGVGIVGDYFLKVRYTYPDDRKEEGSAESVEWMRKLRIAVSEPYLRTMAEESLKEYHQDPLSEEGVAAASGVLAYAEASPFVWLTVPAEIAQWGKACNNVAPDSHLHLLRAYIVGGVEASMKGQSDDEVIEGAMAGTAELYKKLKKQHAGLKSDDLEKLVEAVDAKKAAEFFKKLDSLSKTRR